MWQTAATTTTSPEQGCLALASPRYELIPVGDVLERAQRLPANATVTVTCSPKHGIETSLDLAEKLSARGYTAVPHIAARLVRSRAELRDILHRVADSGLQDVFIVGGDSPSVAGPYPGGRELLEAVAEAGPRPRRVGVPAYPEPHASIPVAHMDSAMETKNTLADYAVTQICFDPEVILAWLAEQHRGGMHLPVHVGLPGVIDRARLMGLAMRIGLGASTRVLRRQSGLASRLLGSSSYQPDHLVQALVPAFGAPATPNLAGFHINTFNQVDETVAWVERTALELRRYHAAQAPAMAPPSPQSHVFAKDY